jgi:hypothetical protein
MSGIRQVGWFRRQSEWDYAQSWRDRRGSMAQSFIRDGAMTGSALTTIWANFSSGPAALSAKAAATRIQAEAKAKFDELSKINISV